MTVQKNESLLHWYISQIYLSNGKTVSRFFVFPQTCVSDSARYNNVRFNYTTCLMIIITQTGINQKNLTVGLSLTFLIQNRKYKNNRAFCFLQQLHHHFESYDRNSNPVISAKWEHQWLDWNDHITKLLHENKFTIACTCFKLSITYIYNADYWYSRKKKR